MSPRNGFTIFELLLAAAILTVVLAMLGTLFASTTRAYRTNERLAERQQTEEIAAQLIKYEVGLAGYRGTVAASFSGNTLTAPQLTITRGTSGAPDTLQTRYFEDRFLSSGSYEQRDVTFSIGTDGGVSTLMRGGVAAVRNVQSLKVVQFVLKDGTNVAATSSPTLTADNPLVALNMRLTFVGGSTKDFTLGFANPLQTSNVSIN